MEVVEADAQSFQASTSEIEDRCYNGDFSPSKFIEKVIEGVQCIPRHKLQLGVGKMLMKTIIVPSRPIIQTLIVEIDD